MKIDLTEETKRRISDEAIMKASGILSLAMQFIEAENFIEGEVDYGSAGRFRLKFERINSSNIGNVSGDQC
ncbi:MAG: hypothetical protein VYB44_07285 [Bacteroidota bacterium]|nr:hypothetical protein [Bacteroidota bacterium]